MLLGRSLLMKASGATASDVLWTPAQIATAMWFDASDASTITTVSGAVSQWNDKSGNNRNATQSNVANRPTYTIAGLNGNNVITFDGVSDHLIHSFNGSPAPHSVFAVVRRTTGGAAYQIAITAIAPFSAFGVGLYAKIGDSENWGAYIDGWANSGSSLLNAWEAVGVISPSTANGTEIFDTSGTVTTASYTTRYAGDSGIRRAIGGDPFFNNGWLKGDIGEIVVIMSALSQPEQNRMIGYLAWHWGLQGNLPANHPYKNAAPTI